jgi:Ca2+/Na+ antiporter
VHSPNKETLLNDSTIYEERVSSYRTEALFIGLTILFLVLLIWQINAGSSNVLRAASLFLFAVFLFYSVNYRTLMIRLTQESLKLKFGIFTWTFPYDNVEECRHDVDLSLLQWYGGAGIHFMLVQKRYRASFNFLEHPRVVIALKRKAGIVRDISFSTRRPDEVIRLLQNAAASQSAA